LGTRVTKRVPIPAAPTCVGRGKGRQKQERGGSGAELAKESPKVRVWHGLPAREYTARDGRATGVCLKDGTVLCVGPGR
ncbi:MAG: hypothetical protein ACETVZ_03475, partial [Phycisphaerae bacterium]